MRLLTRRASGVRRMKHTLSAGLSFVTLCALAAWTSPERTLSRAPSPASAPFVTGFSAVTAFDGGFLVTFEDDRTGRSNVRAVGVRFDELLRAVDPVGVSVTENPRENWDPRPACAGNRCLVAWTHDLAGVAVASLDPRTGAVGPNTLLGGAGYRIPPAVAALPSGNFLVLWSKGFELSSRIVDANGTPLGPENPVSVDPLVDRVGWPTLVAGDAGVLAAWVEAVDFPDGGFDSRVSSRALSAAGVPIAPPYLHGPTRPFWGAPVPSVVWTGTTYLVAWAGNGLLVQRIASSGAPSDVTPITLRQPVTDVADPSFAVDGAHLVGVWFENGNLIGGRFRSADLAVATAPTQLASGNLARPRIAWGAGRGLVAFERFNVLPWRVLVGGLEVLPDAGFRATSFAPALTGTLRYDGEPTAVWTGAGWLSAWREVGNDAPALMGRPLTAQGDPLLVPRPFSDGGFPLAPALGFAGQQAHLVFIDDDTARMTWRALSVDGRPLGSSVALGASMSSLPARAGLASTRTHSMIAWTGLSQVWATTVPLDGGQPMPARAVGPAPFSPTVFAMGASADTCMVAWAENGAKLKWGVLLPGPPPTLVGVGEQDIGSGLQDVSLASDGRDFLVAFSRGTSYYDALALRLSADAGRLDTAPLELSVGGQQARTPNPLAVAFDGRAYRVAYARGGDAGGDLYWRRVWSDGGVDAEELLATGLGDQEDVNLTAGTPGRLLISWREYDAVSRSAVVRSKAWAELEPGAACSQSAECRVGACVNLVCCDTSVGPCVVSDAGLNDAGPNDAGLNDAGLNDAGPSLLTDGGAGGLDERDAGFDAGVETVTGSPQVLRVGFGCASGPGQLHALLVLLAKVAIRRRRR